MPPGPLPDRTPRFRPLLDDDPAAVGPFRLVGRVGSGGMGTVYAGVGPDGRVVAVKTIHPELAADPGFRERFVRETDLVTRVQTPRVPGFLGAGPGGGTPWLATEYVPGTDLGSLVRQRGPLPGNLMPGLAAGVAEALRVLHTNRIVHRDLKPANIMVAPGGPRVLDFGIARAADETVLTRAGGLVGTPGWIAPELYEGHEASAACDMFAWGGLVAFAATGRAPFGDGVTEAMAFRVSHTEPDLDGVPGELLPLVRRALSATPGERPSPEEVLRALVPDGQVEGVLDRAWSAVTATVPRPAARRRRRRDRNGRAWVAGALAVCVVGAAAVAGLLSVPEDGQPAGGEAAGDGGPPAGPSWDPPEAATEGTGRSDRSAVEIREGTPVFSSEQGPMVTEVQALEITAAEGSGVSLTFFGAGYYELTVDELVERLFVVTPEGRIVPDRWEASDEHGAHDSEQAASTPEATVFFEGAPPLGLLVYGDGDHEPHTDTVQPVGACYDAEAGDFSLDFDTCLPEIAEQDD